jgi:hypothetical protein
MKLQVGHYNTLTIVREKEQGLYLSDGEREVLLPRKFVTPDMREGDEIEVFVLRDSEDRLLATTQRPLGTVGDFVALRVASTTSFGAFLDWGLEKDLFVPRKEMEYEMRRGEKHVVLIAYDGKSDRLVGISRLYSFFDRDTSALQPNQEVDLLVYDISERGYYCVINQRYAGLLYGNEVYDELEIGDSLKGYIKHIRQEDGKVDLGVRPQGFQGVLGQEGEILERLKSSGGFLPYHDDSDPEEIRRAFKMSKKTFKKLIGILYKKGLISLEYRGIKLK